MRCVDCELHDCIVGTHFCNYKGKSGRRKPRRISEEDAHKDVPCEFVEEMKGADGKRGRVMKLIIAYAICGILTAMIAMLEKYRKGEFDPHNADENDEEAIGNIVLLWWLYIYQRLTQGE